MQFIPNARHPICATSDTACGLPAICMPRPVTSRNLVDPAVTDRVDGPPENLGVLGVLGRIMGSTRRSISIVHNATPLAVDLYGGGGFAHAARCNFASGGESSAYPLRQPDKAPSVSNLRWRPPWLAWRSKCSGLEGPSVELVHTAFCRRGAAKSDE